MIEIIKRGTKKSCTCKECGCIFRYEEEDIEVENKYTFSCLGVEGHTWVELIMCPQCDEKIILKQSKGEQYGEY